MKNKKYIIIIFLIITIITFSYSILIKATTSNLVLSLSVDKEVFILGEDIDVMYTVENMGKDIDTVINFDEWTMCTNTKINSDKSSSFPYGDEGPMVLSSSKINPGEKFSTKSKINFFRGSLGSPHFSFFPTGNYTLKGICEDINKHRIESKKIEFTIIEPKGENLKAFNDFKFFTDYYNDLEKKRITLEDHKKLTDKTIEFLYAYPNSPYTGKLLMQSCWNRKTANYKYDDSFLKDLEYYMSHNLESYYNKGLISEAVGYFNIKKLGKERTLEYLNSLSKNLKNEKIDLVIQFVKSHSKELK